MGNIYINEKFAKPDQRETDLVINFNDNFQAEVNRSILVERCPFFGSMYNGGYKEANQKEIDVKYESEVNILPRLIDYINTGRIEVPSEIADVAEFIRAALYFQLLDLVKFCCNVLKQNLSPENLEETFSVAKTLFLMDLRKDILEFQGKFFERIAKIDDFLTWTVDRIEELLGYDGIVVSNEKKVVKFLIKWLDQNQLQGECAKNMFRKIRFSHLKTEDVNKIVHESSNETLCQIFHQIAGEFLNKSTSPRIYHKGIYFLGSNNGTNTFARYWPDDSSVTDLKAPNAEDVSNAKLVANDGDEVYMIRHEIVSDQQSIFHIEKYNVLENTWSSRTSKYLNVDDIPSAIIPDSLSVSHSEEKILVCLWCKHQRRKNKIIYFEYCVTTDTWQGDIRDGGSEHMLFMQPNDDNWMQLSYSNFLPHCAKNLQSTASESISFPHNLQGHIPIAYNSKNLLFSIVRAPLSISENWEHSLAVFHPYTAVPIQYHPLDALYYPDSVRRPELKFTLFNGSVYVATRKLWKLYRIDDFSFIGKPMDGPRFLPLAINELKMKYISDIVSIQ